MSEEIEVLVFTATRWGKTIDLLVDGVSCGRLLVPNAAAERLVKLLAVDEDILVERNDDV